MAYRHPNDPINIAKARESRRKHYRRNKEKYYENNRKKKESMRAYIASVKDKPCMDCGKKYPHYVMDLDHRDPSLKCGTINVLLNRGSWKNLKLEIEKCDVVCSNCHRERTHGCVRKASTGFQTQ